MPRHSDVRATHLSTSAWPEVEEGAASRVLLVPVGSTEQHGPHLPFDTDTRIAVAIADAAADQFGTGCVVAPVMAYGASGEHAGFGGTLSIGHEVLRDVVVEIGRSADAFASVVFVNGHGGNVAALTSAAETLRYEGRVATVWSWGIRGGDAHAGRTETSLMLAIAPEAVALDRAEAGRIEPLSEIVDDLRSVGMRGVSPNGVLGDPAGASLDEGHSILESIVADLCRAVHALVEP